MLQVQGLPSTSGVHVPRHLSASPETQAAVLQMVSSLDSPTHSLVIPGAVQEPPRFRGDTAQHRLSRFPLPPPPLIPTNRKRPRHTGNQISYRLLSAFINIWLSLLKWYFSKAIKSISSTLPLKSRTGSQGLPAPNAFIPSARPVAFTEAQGAAAG